MAEYLIQDSTLTAIGDAIRDKTGITGSILVSNMASEIANIKIGDDYKLPTLNENYPEDVTTTVISGSTTSATFITAISEPGNPAEYTYQWYVDGVAVEGATSSTYVMNDLFETTIYTVYCEVTNKKGTVTSRSATLEVVQIYTPILNASYPLNANVAKNESVTSTVIINEDGAPASYTYQWYKNGIAIQGATNSSYIFTPTDYGATTLYCKVTNSAGTVTSRTATINANYLFKAGMTSGLSTIAWKGHAYQNAKAPSVSYKSDGAYIRGPSEPGQNGMAYFGAIDLTNINKITLKLTVSGMDIISDYKNCHCVGVWKTIGSGIYGSNAAAISLLTNNNNVTHTLNVSGLAGLYHVGVGMRKGNSGSPLVVIREIILS